MGKGQKAACTFAREQSPPSNLDSQMIKYLKDFKLPGVKTRAHELHKQYMELNTLDPPTPSGWWRRKNSMLDLALYETDIERDSQRDE